MGSVGAQWSSTNIFMKSAFDASKRRFSQVYFAPQSIFASVQPPIRWTMFERHMSSSKSAMSSADPGRHVVS